MSNKPEEKDEFFKLLSSHHNNKVIKRLYEILEADKAAIEKLEITPDAMDNTNWANKQAYFNGQKYAIKQILDLLEFTQ